MMPPLCWNCQRPLSPAALQAARGACEHCGASVRKQPAAGVAAMSPQPSRGGTAVIEEGSYPLGRVDRPFAIGIAVITTAYVILLVLTTVVFSVINQTLANVWLTFGLMLLFIVGAAQGLVAILRWTNTISEFDIFMTVFRIFTHFETRRSPGGRGFLVYQHFVCGTPVYRRAVYLDEYTVETEYSTVIKGFDGMSGAVTFCVMGFCLFGCGVVPSLILWYFLCARGNHIAELKPQVEGLPLIRSYFPEPQEDEFREFIDFLNDARRSPRAPTPTMP